MVENWSIQQKLDRSWNKAQKYLAKMLLPKPS